MPPGYPPTHRKRDELQPEVCDVCGLQVGAARLQLQTDVQGLQGRRVCDLHEWRGIPTFQDLERMNPGLPGPKLAGQGRVWEPGDETWWQTWPKLVMDTTGNQGISLNAEGTLFLTLGVT